MHTSPTGAMRKARWRSSPQTRTSRCTRTPRIRSPPCSHIRTKRSHLSSLTPSNVLHLKGPKRRPYTQTHCLVFRAHTDGGDRIHTLLPNAQRDDIVLSFGAASLEAQPRPPAWSPQMLLSKHLVRQGRQAEAGMPCPAGKINTVRYPAQRSSPEGCLAPQHRFLQGRRNDGHRCRCLPI